MLASRTATSSRTTSSRIEGAATGDFGLVELPDVETLHDGRIPGSFGFIADEVLADPLGSEGAPADVLRWPKASGRSWPDRISRLRDTSRLMGAATLSRRLVTGNVAALDELIDRATAPVQIRLTMRQLADELAVWAEVPTSRELPENLAEAVQLARAGMQRTFTERDAQQARAHGFQHAHELVRQRSVDLIQVLTELDPSASTDRTRTMRSKLHRGVRIHGRTR